MADAPERIWAGDFDMGLGHCTAGMQGGLYEEYIRADIAASQLAEARAKEETWHKLYQQALVRENAVTAERDRLAADNALERDGFAEPDVMAMSNGVISLHYEDLDAAQSAFDWLEARAMEVKHHG